LGILAFFIIGSLFIYSIKDFENETTPSYELTSKEFGFLLNNLLLVVLAVSILFGTIFPLIYEAITDGKQISVGAPYFEVILFPFALALGLLQGFALYLSWGTSSSFKFLPRLLIESVSVFLLILIILFILFDNLHLTSFATIFLSSWILMGTLQINKNKNLNYWRFLRKRAAVTFAHSGMAILTLGVAVVSSYSIEKEIILAPDDSVEFGNQTILFKNTEDIMGPNYFSKSATMSFSDGSNFSDVLTEKRTYSPSGQLTTEAGIKTEIFQDLYISMGDNLEADIWSFKVQIKPFIRWIWLGALMIAIGSLLAGIKRVRKT
jgi:cytochrome c-type biogenesis protein CcmF